MDSFLTQMKILQDIIAKKKNVLSQIHCITENQNMVLLAKDTEEGMFEMFNVMNEEKQLLIDEVISLDDGFQGMFQGFKSEFEAKALLYPNESQMLKNNIKDVMDFDIKIRVLEGKNKSLLTSAPAYTVGKNWFIDDESPTSSEAIQQTLQKETPKTLPPSNPLSKKDKPYIGIDVSTEDVIKKNKPTKLIPKNYILGQYAKNSEKPSNHN